CSSDLHICLHLCRLTPMSTRQKRPVRPPGPARRMTPLRTAPQRSACDFDVLGAWALRPLPDLERHPLVFLQRLVTFAADFRVMREKVFTAVIGSNEPVTLFGVEPLDDACCHGCALHLRNSDCSRDARSSRMG